MAFEGYIPPWQYDQAADQAPAATAESPDLVTIPQKEWLRGPAGPVPLGGKGMLLTGGPPSAPQPMVPWASGNQAPEMTPLLPPEAIRELFMKVSPAEALKAVEAATQLEGILGFDADRKAGVPVPEALLKWGPKMYHRNPSAVAAMRRELTPFKPSTMTVGGRELIQTSPNRFQIAPQSATAGPITAEPILGPSGEVLGHAARGERGSLHMIPAPKREGATDLQKEAMIRHRLDQLKQESTETDDPKRIQEITAEQARLRQEHSRLTANLLRPIPYSSATPDKSRVRSEAQTLIQKYPSKADAIRKRFKERFGEDL